MAHTRHMGHFHLAHHLEEMQNSCSSSGRSPSSSTPPLKHRLAYNIDATSAVAWGMIFAAKDGGKHFSGPGSLFLAQKLDPSYPLGHIKISSSKPNLIQYICLQKTVFHEKMNCIHIYFFKSHGNQLNELTSLHQLPY